MSLMVALEDATYLRREIERLCTEADRLVELLDAQFARFDGVFQEQMKRYAAMQTDLEAARAVSRSLHLAVEVLKGPDEVQEGNDAGEDEAGPEAT